jgi:hypothetical protein
MERQPAQIGSDISEGETAGGQAESGFVEAVARSVVSGEHFA